MSANLIEFIKVFTLVFAFSGLILAGRRYMLKWDDVDKENYHDNCLYLALKAAGLPEDKLQQLKIFVMNRIIPKCKLGEVCKLLQVCIK